MDIPADEPSPPTGTHGSNCVQFTLAADPACVGIARRRLRDALRGWGLSAVSYEDVALVLSEIVTNALVHGTQDLDEATPPPYEAEPIGVSLHLFDDALKIVVTDPSGQPPQPERGNPDAEGGRGLTLVSHLAKDWGWTAGANGGKAVWSLFAVA